MRVDQGAAMKTGMMGFSVSEALWWTEREGAALWLASEARVSLLKNIDERAGARVRHARGGVAFPRRFSYSQRTWEI
jgi:hypothetical protein